MMNLLTMHEELIEEMSDYEGQFAYVISEGDEVIRFNEHMAASPASTIKVPILVEVLRQCDKGKLALEQMIEIKEADKTGGSGVLQAMNISMLSLRDLLTLMIIVSDNTATNIVIELVGVEQMNEGFSKMGMSSTTLSRKMMDLERLQSGIDNVTTANDLHTCLKAVNDEVLLSKTSRKIFYDIMHHQQFQHKLPFHMDIESIKIWNKTGSIAGVENDCGIFQKRERTVYAAIMCSKLTNERVGLHFIQQAGKKISELLEER